MRLLIDIGAGAKRSSVDVGGIIALVSAGVQHLVISSRNHDPFIDLELKTDKGWKRLEKCVAQIFAKCFGDE